MSAFLFFELKSTEIPLLCLTLSEQAFTHKQARESDVSPFLPSSFPLIYPSGQGKKQPFVALSYIVSKGKVPEPISCQFSKGFRKT